MGRRRRQIPIAVDQFVNTLFGGWADETISSVAWRKRCESKGWALLRALIDTLFFWQDNHCRSAWESEKNRLQCPPELREGK